MAEEDDYKRRRRREEEREREDEEDRRKQQEITGTFKISDLKADEISGKVDELLKRAEPMIDQVNSLYNQYVSGAEKRPPEERRKQLDQLMLTLTALHKPNPGLLFRFHNLQASYSTHREKWDKYMKDIESGKIKRSQGPKFK